MKKSVSKFLILFSAIASVVAIVACNSGSGSSLKRFCGLLGIDFSQFILIGQDGFSASTTDAGASFRNEDSGTVNDLHDIKFGANAAWAVGAKGTLLTRLSLSAEYKRVDLGIDEDLNAIKWIDDKRAIIVGQNERVVRTDDGGANWNVLIAGTMSNIDLNDVDCVGSWCWAVGSRGSIYRSIDYGLTWRHEDSGTTEDLNGVFVGSANRVWAVGNMGAFTYTVNGGDDWELHSNLGTTRDLYKLHFNSDFRKGVIVGDGFLGRTEDAGVTWQENQFIRSLGALFKFLTLVLEGDVERLFFGGDADSIFYSDDYGLTINEVPITFSSPGIGGGTIGETPVSTIDNPVSTGSDSGVVAGEISKQDFSFTHNVGSTSCPQKIGEFTLSNTGNFTTEYVISFDTGNQLSASPQKVTLEPGQSTTVMLFFTCAEAKSFNGNMTVTGTAVDASGSTSVTANVKGTVQ